MRLNLTLLAGQGRWDQLRLAVQHYADKKDNDPRIDELLALQEMHLGQFPVAENRLRALLFAGEDVVAGVLNNLAWAAVASGSVNQQALDHALSAVKRTKQENAACLKTLATVYAELGKTSRPWKLRRAVEIRGERTEEADWYVLGRIAEDYGLEEVAAGLYRKVSAKQAIAAMMFMCWRSEG